MLYCIGGSSRCGKSTLARSVRRHIDGGMISGDALRTALRQHTTADHEPLLHWRDDIDLSTPEKYVAFYATHHAQIIENLRQEAGSLWKYIESYINAVHAESGDDVLIESIDIWPELLAVLTVPHKACFLVDTNPEQWRRIVEARHDDAHDWMWRKGFTDEQVTVWASFAAARSQYIKKQASIYQYPCYDLAEMSFDDIQRRAAEELLA